MDQIADAIATTIRVEGGPLLLFMLVVCGMFGMVALMAAHSCIEAFFDGLTKFRQAKVHRKKENDGKTNEV